METLAVSTVVYAPPQAVYAFLLDLPRYARYASHLKSVDRDGDGGPGTEYACSLAWWRLSYTARVRVTAVDPPARIDWRLVDGVDARGAWEIEPASAAARSPDERATRVRLCARADPDTVDERALGLPRLVSLDRIVDRLAPVVEREAERVVQRAVADLEGDPRPVELVVEDPPG